MATRQRRYGGGVTLRLKQPLRVVIHEIGPNILLFRTAAAMWTRCTLRPPRGRVWGKIKAAASVWKEMLMTASLQMWLANRPLKRI